MNKMNVILRKTMQTFVICFFVWLIPTNGHAQTNPQFKVIAFYNGTWDAAHISFVQEANNWFPQMAAQYNFSYTATNNWSLLNASNLAQYKLVLFLDDAPPAAQRAAFQQYMNNGGAWMGFHVCAFNTNPADWDWYYNQFLSMGSFRTNTWGPTTANFKVEDLTHPATLHLPSLFTSAVSEWYGWNVELRTRSNIRILCSIDPSSFPLGTDPNQSWYSGYFPVVWTNTAYKMIYFNFGHNDMDYSNNTTKSYTFSNVNQNRMVMDALLWLGGASTPIETYYEAPGTVQAENYSSMNGVQTEVTTDAGGGSNVGWIDAGDRLTFNINVATAGTYTVGYRIASLNGGGSMRLEKSDASQVFGTIAVPSTSGWQTWTTITHDVNLSAGKQKISLAILAGGFNLNWIGFTKKLQQPVAPIGSTIWLRGNNNMYVCSENGTTTINCNRPAVGGWEKFDVLDGGNGKIILRGTNLKYMSSENGNSSMTCSRTTYGATELFDWVSQGTNTMALRGNNSQYVSSENGTKSMNCNRATIGGWEVFTWAVTTKSAFTDDSYTHQNLSLFPNPATESIQISGITLNDRVMVYDLTGNLLLSEIVDNNSFIQLNISSFINGSYIVKITGINQVNSIRFVVNR